MYLEHIEGKLIGRRICALKGEQQTSDMLGVIDNMILQKLMQLQNTQEKEIERRGKRHKVIDERTKW